MTFCLWQCLIATSANNSVLYVTHPLSALVAIAAENSLLFMAYGATQRLVSHMTKVKEEELGVLGHGLAGAFWYHFSTCPTIGKFPMGWWGQGAYDNSENSSILASTLSIQRASGSDASF